MKLPTYLVDYSAALTGRKVWRHNSKTFPHSTEEIIPNAVNRESENMKIVFRAISMAADNFIVQHLKRFKDVSEEMFLCKFTGLYFLFNGLPNIFVSTIYPR